MAAPIFTMENDDGTPLGAVVFEPRPTGSAGPARKMRIWNDKAAQITGESLGAGDGTRTSFQAAHGNILAGRYTVKVEGTAKTEGTDFSMNPSSGVVTFLPGAIPQSGQAVTLDYEWSNGGGQAGTVWITSQARAQFSGDGAKTAFSFPAPAQQVYEVLVNGGVVREGWTHTETALAFQAPPAAGASVEVFYETRGVAAGVAQVQSQGVEDPYNRGIVADGKVSYTAVGGSEEALSAMVGTGDGIKTLFDLPAGGPLVPRTVQAKVNMGVTPVTVHPLLLQIEFETPPAVGAVVRASFRYLRAARLGAMPPQTARNLLLRGKAPATGNDSLIEGMLVVEGM